jgi:hypothetical protein
MKPAFTFLTEFLDNKNDINNAKKYVSAAKKDLEEKEANKKRHSGYVSARLSDHADGQVSVDVKKPEEYAKQKKNLQAGMFMCVTSLPAMKAIADKMCGGSFSANGVIDWLRANFDGPSEYSALENAYNPGAREAAEIKSAIRATLKQQGEANISAVVDLVSKYSPSVKAQRQHILTAIEKWANNEKTEVLQQAAKEHGQQQVSASTSMAESYSRTRKKPDWMFPAGGLYESVSSYSIAGRRFRA